MLNVPFYTRKQLEQVLSVPDLLPLLESAFKDYSAGLGESPVAVLHPTDASDLHVKSATLKGRTIFTIKAAGWSAALRDRTGNGSSGLILAFDSETCLPVAILDEQHFVSDIRTAAAGALASKYFARSDTKVVGIVGSGVQAFLQLSAALCVRSFERVLVWSRTKDKAEALVRKIRQHFPAIDARATSLEETVRSADLLVTATSSTEPLVRAEWIPTGQHITAVGSDDDTKCELEPVVLKNADMLIVDSIELAQRYGDVHRALREGVLSVSDISGELGQVFSGQLPAREDKYQITIVKLVGLGVQDLVTVEHALNLLLGQSASLEAAE
jgi:ornithine cyclodeaminase/alanine dehydrogenase-like protein (mu-crystallin family)